MAAGVEGAFREHPQQAAACVVNGQADCARLGQREAHRGLRVEGVGPVAQQRRHVRQAVQGGGRRGGHRQLDAVGPGVAGGHGEPHGLALRERAAGHQLDLLVLAGDGPRQDLLAVGEHGAARPRAGTAAGAAVPTAA